MSQKNPRIVHQHQTKTVAVCRMCGAVVGGFHRDSCIYGRDRLSHQSREQRLQLRRQRSIL